MRSNTKKAIENIRKYIIDVYEDYTEEPATLEEIASVVFDDCNRVLNKTGYISQDKFDVYASRLPSYVETYGYHAHGTLAEILEETPEEASKYTNQQAEKQLTYLVYRELRKAYKGDL